MRHVRHLRLITVLAAFCALGTAVKAQTVEMTPVFGLAVGQAIEPPTIVDDQTLRETVIRPAAGFGIRVRPWGDLPLAFGASATFAQGRAQDIWAVEAGFRHRKEMLSFTTDIGVYYDFQVAPVVVTIGGIVGPEVLEVEDVTESPLEGAFFARESSWRVSGGPVAEVSVTVIPGLRAAAGLAYRLNRPAYRVDRPPPLPGAEGGEARVRLSAFTPMVVVLVGI